MKNKILATISIVSVIAVNLILASPAQAAISAGSLIETTNQTRQANGLKPYKINADLAASAYAKAQDMLKFDYFEHYSPQGKSPWSFIRATGYTYTFAGENLAIDFTDNSTVQAAWMASPTHRANILDKDFTEIGIAAVSGEYKGRSTTVVVEHFGARAVVQSSDVAGQKEAKIDQNPKKDLSQINIDLPQNKIPEIVVNSSSTPNLIWYSSPALALIKILV